MTPAILPPSDVVRKKPPIMSAVRRRGATFDTSDKPIGLRNSSLMVNTP